MNISHIPFANLQKQYREIQPEINRAIKRVLNKQLFILGEELVQFEQEYAKYLGAKYCVGVASGTDGLLLAVSALNLGKGDEVITQTNGYISTAMAISKVGAKPVLVDCYPKTYQIDIEQVEKKITKKTKAILLVHLYGAPADMLNLIKLAKKYNVPIIEDACQAHGATYKNKKLGTIGEIGVFSFYPSKNLGAYGDGGAIVTNKKKLYKKLIMLRDYGQPKRYYHHLIGYNSRLDEMQAAILRVKLKYLDHWNKQRNNHATQYKKLLGEIVNTQMIIDNSVSNYHLFVIEVDKRDKLQKFLWKNGISTLIHYPVPIHMQKCYRHLGYKSEDLPHSGRLAKRILSLPMFAELTNAEIAYVVRKVKEFYSVL